MNTQAATKTAHTPTPWRFAPTGPRMSEVYSQSFAIHRDGKADLIAGLFSDVHGGDETAKANAALIVRAVNSHAELVGLAIMCNAYLQPIADLLELCHNQPHEAKALHQLLDMARAALAKAKGVQP